MQKEHKPNTKTESEKHKPITKRSIHQIQRMKWKV